MGVSCPRTKAQPASLTQLFNIYISVTRRTNSKGIRLHLYALHCLQNLTGYEESFSFWISFVLKYIVETNFLELGQSVHSMIYIKPTPVTASSALMRARAHTHTHTHTHTHSFTNGTPQYALLTQTHISTAVQRPYRDMHCCHTNPQLHKRHTAICTADTHTHTHYKANWRTLTCLSQLQIVPQTANNATQLAEEVWLHLLSLQRKRGYIYWSKCEKSKREMQTET